MLCPLMSHVPGPLDPPVNDALLMVTPAGIVSVTCTSCAVEFPALVAVIVKVTFPPASTVWRFADLSSVRFTPQMTSKKVESELSSLLPVSFDAVTVAVFVILGQAPTPTVTSIVTVADAPAPSEPMSQLTSWPLMSHVPGPFEPPVKLASSMSRPAGTVSVTVTSCAVALPLFVTTMLKLAESPGDAATTTLESFFRARSTPHPSTTIESEDEPDSWPDVTVAVLS
jgi:hypothetical protein